jgi:hypothetical protein
MYSAPQAVSLFACGLAARFFLIVWRNTILLYAIRNTQYATKKLYKLALLWLLLRGGLACQISPFTQMDLMPLPTIEPCRAPFWTYNRDIKPIFETHCTRCHGENNAAKGIRFDYYWAAKTFVGDDTTRFFCVINHHADCLPMPMGAPKMDACAIQKLETWVRRGLVEH